MSGKLTHHSAVAVFQLACVAIIVSLLASPTPAQSTAFTYQGSLEDAGQPASGIYDIRFKLFSTSSGGTQIGATHCVDNVPVSNGRFATLIDFGQQFTTPANLHLEIDVRPDAGQGCSNSAGFTTLMPRQEITPTPVAIHADSAFEAEAAFALDAPDGSPLNAVIVDNDGQVGINTLSPLNRLHVTSAALGDGIRLSGSVGTDPSIGLFEGTTPRGTLALALNPGFFSLDADPGDIVLRVETGGKLLFQSGFQNSSLAIDSNNNVGIGTADPTAKLDVRGDISLGAEGQFNAVAGEENLRIVRGIVSGDATIAEGSGFTVLSGPVGSYSIRLTTPMGGVPTAVATTIGPAGRTAQATVMSATLIRVETQLSGNPFAVPFNFIIVGPR